MKPKNTIYTVSSTIYKIGKVASKHQAKEMPRKGKEYCKIAIASKRKWVKEQINILQTNSSNKRPCGNIMTIYSHWITCLIMAVTPTVSKLLELPLEDDEESTTSTTLLELPLDDESNTNSFSSPESVQKSLSTTTTNYEFLSLSGQGSCLLVLFFLVVLAVICQIMVVLRTRSRRRTLLNQYADELQKAENSKDEVTLEKLLEQEAPFGPPFGYPRKNLLLAQTTLRVLRKEKLESLALLHTAVCSSDGGGDQDNDTTSLKLSTILHKPSTGFSAELRKATQDLEDSAATVSAAESRLMLDRRRPSSFPMTSPERRHATTDVATLLTPEGGTRFRANSKLMAKNIGMSEEKVKEMMVSTMLQHSSATSLQNEHHDLLQQQHEDAMQLRQDSLHTLKEQQRKQQENLKKSIEEERKNVEKKLQQEKSLHDETLNDTRHARQEDRRERDLMRYQEALGERQANDTAVLWRTVYWSLLVMLAISVLVLWDRLNMEWMTTCSVDDRGAGSSGGGNSSGDSRLNRSWWSSMNPFRATSAVMQYVSQYGCAAVQYAKIFVVVGLVCIITAVVTTFVSFEGAMMVLGAILLGLLREHLGNMVTRAVYSVPFVLVCNVLLFLPLRWRCCRECGGGGGLEWNVCGVDARPFFVNVALPLVAMLIAIRMGLQVACDDEEMSATTCASRLFEH